MTYRAALIGTDGIGRRHGDSYHATDGVELAAVADIEEELLDAAGERWNVPDGRRYLDHRTMLETESVDVVSVATPSAFHHRHVMDTVESAASPDAIWCEKPIATRVTDAEEMVAACEAADTELVVNHSRRFHEAYVELRELIASEDILGDVLAVHGGFGRELLRNGTHTLDLVNFLVGLDADTVSGYLTGEHGRAGSVPDSTEGYDDCGGGGIVVTADGAYVNVDHTVPREFATASHVFTGTGGHLHVDETGGEWWYRRTENGEQRPATLGTEFGGLRLESLFDGAVEHLVDLLDGNAQNRSPGAEAAEVLEVLVALFVSHFTGSRVSLPLEAPLREVTITSW